MRTTMANVSSNVLGCWSRTLVLMFLSPIAVKNASLPITSYISPHWPGKPRASNRFISWYTACVDSPFLRLRLASSARYRSVWLALPKRLRNKSIISVCVASSLISQRTWDADPVRLSRKKATLSSLVHPLYLWQFTNFATNTSSGVLTPSNLSSLIGLRAALPLAPVVAPVVDVSPFSLSPFILARGCRAGP